MWWRFFNISKICKNKTGEKLPRRHVLMSISDENIKLGPTSIFAIGPKCIVCPKLLENCYSPNRKRLIPYKLTKIPPRELTHAGVKPNVT